MNDELGQEGFGRKRTLWRGGEWDDDSAHHQVDRTAVDDATEEWRLDEGRQFAADDEINQSGGEGDEEVEEEARHCCSCSLLEC